MDDAGGFATISLERRDTIAIVTLRRPAALNAIDTRMVDELGAALDMVAGDDSRALVLTGEGRAFCVGSDLKEEHADGAARIDAMHAMMLRLSDFPKTSVAAINGLALGGGLELALACTFRVAARDARLGLPEIKLALIPSYGATQLLPRLIGPARALAMMLSGDAVGAGEALAMGLVEAVADDAVTDACGFAMRHSGRGDAARLLIRQAMREGAVLPLVDALRIEKHHALANSAHPDVALAIAAFRDR